MASPSGMASPSVTTSWMSEPSSDALWIFVRTLSDQYTVPAGVIRIRKTLFWEKTHIHARVHNIRVTKVVNMNFIITFKVHHKRNTFKILKIKNSKKNLKELIQI